MVTCRVDLCKSAPTKTGLCEHHHKRFLKTGVLDNLRTMTFEERLWSWMEMVDLTNHSLPIDSWKI